jgi:hypothetical protein
MAIGLDLAFHPLSPPAKEKLDPTDLGIKLRRLCGLFVFIKNSRIYLIHQTAREFLISKQNGRPESTKWQQSVNLQEANLAFSQVCMTYLQHCENQENNSQLFEEGEAGIKCDGLLKYSATHWVSHLRGGGNPTVELLQLAGELCDLEKVSMWPSYVEPPFWYIRYIDEPLPFFWAARWGLVDVADFLLQDSTIKITDEIMEKAAAHRSSGNTVMRLLLDRRGHEIKITNNVLQKAAANTDSGFSVMELLLDRRGDEIKITEEVMQKAAANADSGFSIMKLLLDRKGDEIKITRTVMVSAVMNWWSGADIIKFLLDRKGAEIRITRGVIRAALTNVPQRETIIHLLHPRSGYIKRIMRQYRDHQRGRTSDAGKWDKWIKAQRSATIEAGKKRRTRKTM